MVDKFSKFLVLFIMLLGASYASAQVDKIVASFANSHAGDGEVTIKSAQANEAIVVLAPGDDNDYEIFSYVMKWRSVIMVGQGKYLSNRMLTVMDNVEHGDIIRFEKIIARDKELNQMELDDIAIMIVEPEKQSK